MQARSARRFARALLTNDDGIDAPGMAALARVAQELAEEVWIVAPEHDQSGMSRAISLHDPLRLLAKGERRFAVTGTPGDSVIVGLREVLAATPPDIVISGINRGANLGQEVAYSGTVSAALTAKLLGVPGIAFSQAFRDREQVRWHTAMAMIPRVFEVLDGRGGLPEAVLNVNFPDVEPEEVTGFEFTRQAQGNIVAIDTERRTDTRGIDYRWLAFRRAVCDQPEDSDIAALRRCAVSLTPLGFDFTDTAALEALRRR
ncbi:5'/3'-nucleotidase SurE [Rhodocista pekingensis]|uniref:5'-nucleotidase SurE n=1 Tax=Rhodocista pekingensis TaxID=201185 RepID=A0ABW2KRV8_9PROT